MHKLSKDVQDFRAASRLPRFNDTGVPSKERIQLCAALCMEETIEGLEAMGASETTIDLLKLVAKDAIASIDPKRVVLKDVADALGDSDYVNEWARCEFGIHGGPFAAEIQRTNMEKFGPGSSFSPAGKVQKPPGWKPPDMAKVLANQPNVSYVILANEGDSELTLCLRRDIAQHLLDIDGKPQTVRYEFSADTHDEAASIYNEFWSFSQKEIT